MANQTEAEAGNGPFLSTCTPTTAIHGETLGQMILVLAAFVAAEATTTARAKSGQRSVHYVVSSLPEENSAPGQ